MSVVTGKAAEAVFKHIFERAREPEQVKAIRFYVSQGKLDEARSLLAAYNQINRAFDKPEVELPGDLELTEVESDPFRDLAA